MSFAEYASATETTASINVWLIRAANGANHDLYLAPLDNWACDYGIPPCRRMKKNITTQKIRPARCMVPRNGEFSAHAMFAEERKVRHTCSNLSSSLIPATIIL